MNRAGANWGAKAAGAVLLCVTLATAAQTRAVIVIDESQARVPGAAVEIRLRDKVILTAATDETGRAELTCEPGRYRVSASKEGFETAVVEEFECKDGDAATVELTLRPDANRQSIDVQETTSPTEIIVEPAAKVRGESAKQLPSRPSTVSDALPLIPGIARQTTGQLQLSGNGEHRSTMMVNSADVTDPATDRSA